MEILYLLEIQSDILTDGEKHSLGCASPSGLRVLLSTKKNRLKTATDTCSQVSCHLCLQMCLRFSIVKVKRKNQCATHNPKRYCWEIGLLIIYLICLNVCPTPGIVLSERQTLKKCFLKYSKSNPDLHGLCSFMCFEKGGGQISHSSNHFGYHNHKLQAPWKQHKW